MNAILIVPPLLKYMNGPLLGPATLKGAAEAAGHRVRVLDLNICYLQERISTTSETTLGIIGDHDKPSAELRKVEIDFVAGLRQVLPRPGAMHSIRVEPSLVPAYSHDEVASAARALAGSEVGAWIRTRIQNQQRPDLVGLSVLFGGQVIWGLAVSIIAKAVWPGVPVVWGGAHVTGLRDQITADTSYGRIVDGFVFSYAERTFVDLLNAVASGGPWPDACVRAGSGTVQLAVEDRHVLPLFEDLDLYSRRLTVPAQTSRGCWYARCRFCSYPGIEMRARTLPLNALDAAVRTAVSLHGVVAIKDSLVSPNRLGEIADRIAGAVPWSACTKLNPRLDADLLRRIARGGCRTLEIGLETLVPASQILIDKQQPAALFLAILDGAADAGISLVVNYMTGFPGEDPEEAQQHRQRVERELEMRRPKLMAKLEHNEFELDRLAPLATSAIVDVTGNWPWSSLLDWVVAPVLAGRG